MQGQSSVPSRVRKWLRDRGISCSSDEDAVSLTPIGRPDLHVDLTSFSQAYGTADAAVVSDVRRGRMRYVVVIIRRGSRVGPGGYCGAGSETNLVWLAFTPDFSIARSKSHLIESCFHNVEPDTVHVGRPAGALEWRFWTFDKGATREYTVVYDERRPDTGFHVHYAFSDK
jgi:hypothetical protein